MPKPKSVQAPVASQQSSSSAPGQMLKMKALMQATNTTKATILHYVKQGLLPQPVKTSHNMAYYDSASVNTIKFIKHLQAKYGLSLAAIKKIIHEQDTSDDISPFFEMREVVFGKQDTAAMDSKEFCRQSGLTPEQLQACMDAEVLIPKRSDRFDAEDLAIAQILKAGFEVGMSLDEFLYYPRLGKQIVEAEMAIQESFIKDRSFNEAVSITMQLAQSARALRTYIIDRIFQKRAEAQKVFFNPADYKKGQEKND